MKQYKLLNNVTGLVVLLLASLVYIVTAEPTASYWDCSEYISTAYKLQVGHPPGAPFFQLMGRFFSLFAFGNVHNVALMVNIMSALFSGLTILFLFWTITALVKKMMRHTNEIPLADTLLIIGSGVIGALAYTFSDSFWFSAVEGEVYATSSFFTAFVFWAILKWEAVADEPGNYRWLLLIAFCMGLSIGVHLLNLLAIPAITLVFYFRKFKVTKLGTLLAFGVSIVLLAAIMYGIIPQVVALFAKTELLFVNSLGLPFNSGTVFFGLLLLAFVGFGLWYTETNKPAASLLALLMYALLLLLVLYSSTSFWNFILRFVIVGGVSVLIYIAREKKEVLRTVLLGFAFILIGYSSFFMLVIRSNANTPLNENAPRDAISLLSYLNREQYGDWPLFYGPYYNAPLDAKQPYTDGNPLYARDDASKKYIVVDDRKNSEPNYDSRFMTLFPRMWSSNSDSHIAGYKSWGQVSGTPITVKDRYGNPEIIYKPTFLENLRYLFTYQLGHMYGRYFMWNFVGRQNDIQGHGGMMKGNWISGINFLDKAFVGTQKNLPEPLANNKGRNVFYFLPLILGLAGFLIHLNRDLKGFAVIVLMFVFTGIAINFYLNPVPYQPRERDYAYAASFYAFAVWIGMGMIGLVYLFRAFLKPKLSVIIAFLISLFLVPGIMAKGGWNDHDRSGRYTVRDVAADYLNSCAPNAILFTLGDNDTFPLWYAQEVEGIRTDVRVVNLSLLNMDWYIDQMKQKAYDSDPLPITITHDKYVASKRDFVLVYEDTSLVKPDRYADIKLLVEYAASDDPTAMLQTGRGPLNYFPTHNLLIEVDSVTLRKADWIPASYRDSVRSNISWNYSDYGVQKNALIVFDILANNNWKRPVYFATTTGDDAYLGLYDYMQLEGLAYRLVPYKVNKTDDEVGGVNTEIMCDNLINKFAWGHMDNPQVYLDETNMRMTVAFRSVFARLAKALVAEGKLDKALKVCDKSIAVMPDNCVPYTYQMLPIISVYYAAAKNEFGDKIALRLTQYSEQELCYYSQFSGGEAAYLSVERGGTLELLQKLYAIAQTYKRTDLEKEVLRVYNKYESKPMPDTLAKKEGEE
ncbi:MAG: DUF2723 domain-containing protein [Bacteroidota bacterium]